MKAFASYPEEAKEEIYKLKQLKYYVYEYFYVRQKRKELVDKINNSITTRRYLSDDDPHWGVKIDEDSPHFQPVMCVICGNYMTSDCAAYNICCKCPDDDYGFYDYEYY